MPQLLNYVQSGEFAADLELIAQAASDTLSRHDDPDDRNEVTTAIQSMLEFLFSSDDERDYRAPAAFWDGDLGRLIATARLWAQGDTLITHSEAAQLLRGNSGQAALVYVQRLVTGGTLTHYVDSNEPNRQKAGRVSRAEVEALRG